MLDSVIHGKQLNEGETSSPTPRRQRSWGRLSAYTGQVVRMSDILTNKDSPFYNMNCKLCRD